MTDDPSRAASSVRVGRVLRLVFVGSVVILLFSQPFPTLMIPGVRRLLLVLAVVVGLAGWVAEARNPRLPALLVAALGATVVVTALSAWGSDRPSVVFFNLWLAAAYTGIAVLVWRWLQDEDARTEAAVVVGLGGFFLVTVTFLAKVSASWWMWVSLGMSVRDVPLRPENAGGLVPGLWTGDYAILLAPVALLATTLVITRGRQAIQVVIVSVAVATVFVGAVRALWVAAAAVLIVTGAVWAWQRRSSIAAKGRRAWSVIGVGVAGVLVIALIVTPRLGGLLRDVDEGRLDAFSVAIDIFEHSPVLGAGPGTYGGLRVGYPAAAPTRLVLADPHNGLLAALSQTGALGLIALVGVVAVVGRMMLVALRSRFRTAAIAASVGLAIIVLHRMSDLVFLIPGLMVAGIVVVGIAIGRIEITPPAGWRRAASIGIVFVGLLLTGLSLPALIATERAKDTYATAAAAWTRSDLAVAEDRARSAIADAPDLVPAYQLLSMVAARQGDAVAAVSFATEGARLEPMGQNKVRLAMALGQDGQTTEAEAVLIEAIAAPPEDPIVLLNAAAFGPTPERQASLMRLFKVDPQDASFTDAYAGISVLDPKAAIDAAHAELLADKRPDLALRLGLHAERLDLAQSAAAVMTGGSRDAADLLVDGWFGIRDTWADLDTLAGAQPTLAGSAHLLAQRLCRADDVRRWADVIQLQTGDVPTTVVGIGPASGIPEGDYPTRYPSWVWGHIPLIPAYPDAMLSIDRQTGITCR